LFREIQTLNYTHKIHSHPPPVSANELELVLPQRWEFWPQRITT
jgi:hypothetical protein